MEKKQREQGFHEECVRGNLVTPLSAERSGEQSKNASSLNDAGSLIPREITETFCISAYGCPRSIASTLP